MTDSPILHIPQVAPNQINKEVTLNSAIAILERSLNDKVDVDMTAGDVTLNITDYTRFMIAFCSGHTVARVLTVPASKRLFMVKNDGTGVVTVDAGGITQDVAPGSYDGFINDGLDIHKLFDSAAATAVTDFLGLSDTPSTYAGQAGKVPTVNGGESALVFSTPVVGATELDDLTDVDLTTPATSKQLLMYDSASNTWLPVTLGGIRTYAVSSTLALVDAYMWVQGNNAGAMNLTVPPNSSVAFPIGTTIFVENLGAGLVTLVAGAGVTINAKDGDVFTAQFQIGVLKKTGTNTWNFALIGSSAAGVTAFTSLSDVPASYSGQTLKAVRVNAGETALEFYTPSAGVTAFIALSDVPASYSGSALKAVRVNAGATALEFYTPTTGVTAFTGLSDVPASYSGQALKGVRVNSGATALEFYTRNIDSLTDVDTTSAAPSNGDYLKFDGTNWVPFTPRHTIGMFVAGAPTISLRLLQYVAPFAFHLPINLTNSQGYAETAPSGSSVDFDIKKNNVSIGTASFASGSHTPTFTFASGVAFAAGDRLSIHSPADIHSMADVSLTLNGTKD